LLNAKDAIKAQSHPGTIAICIEIRVGLGMLRIRDCGDGIPADVLPKIFAPYFTTNESGLEIGRYMSRMILDHLHDHIEANNVGAGTEIVVSAPALI